MILIGWTILFFLGVALVNMIAYRINVLEKMTFALPMGMGANSLILFLADLVHLPLNSINNFLWVELALAMVLNAVTIRKQRPELSFNPLLREFDLKKLLPLNFSLVFFLGVLLFVTYILVRKSLFWPVVQFDSITGYDFVAKAIVQEGRIKSSLFSSENPLFTIRGLYPPLVPVNFAFAYLLGHGSSQIVVLIFFLCTIASFYLLLKKHCTHLCAVLFTLLLVITPEYAAFSTISSSNIPCTFYASIGMLCMLIWFTDQDKNYFRIGLLFIALAVWTRTEAIIFAAGGGILVLMNARIKKKISLLAILGIPSLLALIIWQWYIKDVLQVSSAQPILDQITWDSGKLWRMLTQVKLVTFSTQYYGITVLLFLAVLLINLKNIFVKKDSLALLLTVFATWILYVSIFYLIDTNFLSNSMEGWIFSGYKRGLFFFFPLMLYYSANNPLSRKLFNEYLHL